MNEGTSALSARDQAVAARDAVLVVRASGRTAILVTGGERTSWLNGLVTCDLVKLAPGEAAYGLLVEKKGRIQTDLVVVPGNGASGGSVVLAVPSALRDGLLPALDHYLIMEDVELAPSDVVFFTAHGPKAKELAAIEPAIAPFVGTFEWLGKGDVIFAVPPSEADAFEARLALEATKRGGGLGDQAGLDALSIERGLPRFGVEFDTSLYPQEASLEKLAVSFSKGCYLGQEVVYMLEHRGHVKRKLVPLDLAADATDAGALPQPGASVSVPGGEAVGEIKSVIVGPTTMAPVAIAMVKWAHAKPETELSVDGRVARVRAFPAS